MVGEYCYENLNNNNSIYFFRVFIDDTAAAMKKVSQETEGRHHSFDDLLVSMLRALSS